MICYSPFFLQYWAVAGQLLIVTFCLSYFEILLLNDLYRKLCRLLVVVIEPLSCMFQS